VVVPRQARSSGGAPRRLRADALRNRERLLAAARDLFVEQGPDAPLEEVARRAGVGIATLYRRFPDRGALMREVALDVLTRVTREARAALAEEPDAFRALGRYLHRALDLRIAAVMPVLADRLTIEGDEELRRARDELAGLYGAMVGEAQRRGLLRADVGFGDIGLLVIRLARPVPGLLPRPMDDTLAHRHLDLLLDGLRASSRAGAEAPLPGRALTLEDLRNQTDVGQPRRGAGRPAERG
jgi:AcrR family transcriptional regulator